MRCGKGSAISCEIVKRLLSGLILAENSCCVVGMFHVDIVTLMAVGVLGVSSKYINEIHGNNVVQDRLTGFHVFELHGFSVGITSSIFIGAALTISATYLTFRLVLASS